MDREEVRVVCEGVSKHTPSPRDIARRDSGAVKGGFGKYEVEEVAGRLVSFFEEKGFWSEFSIEELGDFYRQRGWDPNTMLFGLLGPWYDDGALGSFRQFEPLIVYSPDGKMVVTERFIARCSGNA